MDYRRPFLVIPELIEQPTWGGTFIARFKGWQHASQLHGKKIGQSFELSAASFLSPLLNSSDLHFQPTDQIDEKIALKKMITNDPSGFLGEQLAQKQTTIKLLIKFTQALGNSFQLHVKQPTADGKWVPKPESWYFFAPGKITLGVKPGIDWDKYQQYSKKCDDQMQLLSQKVKTNQITYTNARTEIQKLLKTLNPWQFVNVLPVAKSAILDLTACGIHHSWEEDPTLPHGNLVYELQVDVADNISTIRNFDKGKMRADGSIRQLHVDDYFRYIDRETKANDPQTYYRQPKQVKKTDDYTVDEIFTTDYYAMRQIVFTNAATLQQPLTCYHHVFVKSGTAKITAHDTSVQISQGHAVFIPAMVQSYEIQAEKKTILLISSEENIK